MKGVSPMAPPSSPPRAEPRANRAIRREAAKSLNPSSCSHSVMNTIAFQGMLPTMPCTTLQRAD